MENKALAIALSRLSFLRFAEKAILRKKLDNIASLALLSIEEMSFIVGRELRTALWPFPGLEKRVERDVRIMDLYAIRFCTFFDDAYPPLLRELYDPPFALFWRGSLDCLQSPTAAVVGTRRPTGNGMKAAFETACELALEGISVVSGLALGIDACAHRGCLEAEKHGGDGKACAVLASSADIITPQANAKLGALVAENGCIVSEYPPETDAEKWRFPQRNRIISGLCPLTAVIEAPAGSGALITADFALEQGRELVFHEAALRYPGKPQSGKKSALDYIEDGAQTVQSGGELALLLRSLHFEYKGPPENRP